MGNLSCGNLDPPPSSGGQSAASSPSALHEDGLTKRFRRCRSPFREPPKSDRHPVGMVIAIISESRSASVRNRDRHHLGTLIAIARNTQLRLGIGLASAGVLGADVPIPVVTKVVKTTNGDVQGLVKDGVQVLKGIRYGAAPVGPLRFMPPQRPKPWKGVADATEFGAPAIQMAPPISASPATDFGRQLATIYTTPAEIKIQNEDCLFLNVWTPGLGGGTRRPVMVWLHGGGFAYGSGAWPIYDGANLAKKGDVVVVTVNHRLNVFGYLYLGQLG